MNEPTLSATTSPPADALLENGPEAVAPLPAAPRKQGGHGKAHREGHGHRENGTHPRKNAKLVGVRVAANGMVYRFLSLLKEIKIGDWVYLHGKEEEILGEVLYLSEAQSGENLQERLYTGSFDKIGRILSEAEKEFVADKERLEKEAKQVCQEKIVELQLEMHLSHVHYLSGGGRIVVYFTAENRVDFRELVRQLGTQLKVRVEMRHIGVRDESKILGGLGLCGQPFCCSSFLKRFHPVSVRMAKNQELSLNPEGISGTCGRLLCCLEYENSTYQALREGMPRMKQTVQTVDGREGSVQAIHPLTEKVDLLLADGNRVCVARCELCLNQPLAQLPEEDAGATTEEESIGEGLPPGNTRKRPTAAVTAMEPKQEQNRPSSGRRENQRERQRGRGERPAAAPPTETATNQAPVGDHRLPTATAATEPPPLPGQPNPRKRRRRRRSQGNAEAKETV
ncbi:MAG: hypothetical protein HQM06_09700 [Magnetococcales bacterium]|nr:hypothetical protein [Magnetococcales bacterium]